MSDTELREQGDKNEHRSKNHKTVKPTVSLASDVAIIGKYTQSSKYEIKHIPWKQLKTYPQQVRKSYTARHIEMLKNSIQNEGLKNPLHVIKCDDEDSYFVVDGETRRRACEGILQEVPCYVMDKEDGELWAIKANLLREDLNPLERSDCFLRYIQLNNGFKDPEKYKLDKEFRARIAVDFDISNAMITEILSLQKLPDDIKDEQRSSGAIPLRELKVLTSKKMREDSVLQRQRYGKLKTRHEEKVQKPQTQRDGDLPNQIRAKHISGMRSRLEPVVKYYSDLKFDKFNTEELQSAQNSLESALEAEEILQEVIASKINEIKGLLAQDQTASAS